MPLPRDSRVVALVAQSVSPANREQVRARMDHMQRASKLWIVALLSSGVAVFVAALFAVLPRGRRVGETAAAVSSERVAGRYADPSTCANCHVRIARTYTLTGMARSFARLGAGKSWLGTAGRVDHKASGPVLHDGQRDGKLYQRRHQIGFDGRETNARARGALRRRIGQPRADVPAPHS